MNTLTKSVSLELKSLEDRQFEGHGAVFGNVDYGGDIIIPGAFKKTLIEHRKAKTLPQMFWMHKMDSVPGKWLSMEEDEKGLRVKGELVDTPLGDEVHTLMKAKAVRGLSIGFEIKERDWDKQGNRLLKEIDLWEVSIVSLAMNPLASVTSAKTRLSKDLEYVPLEHEFKRDLEDHLRDAGCPRSVAKRMVAKLFDRSGTSETLGDALRDAEEEDQLSSDEKAVLAAIEKSARGAASAIVASSLKTDIFK